MIYISFLFIGVILCFIWTLSFQLREEAFQEYNPPTRPKFDMSSYLNYIRSINNSDLDEEEKSQLKKIELYLSSEAGLREGGWRPPEYQARTLQTIE